MLDNLKQLSCDCRANNQARFILICVVCIYIVYIHTLSLVSWFIVAFCGRVKLRLYTSISFLLVLRYVPSVTVGPSIVKRWSVLAIVAFWPLPVTECNLLTLHFSSCRRYNGIMGMQHTAKKRHVHLLESGRQAALRKAAVSLQVYYVAELGRDFTMRILHRVWLTITISRRFTSIIRFMGFLAKVRCWGCNIREILCFYLSSILISKYPRIC